MEYQELIKSSDHGYQPCQGDYRCIVHDGGLDPSSLGPQEDSARSHAFVTLLHESIKNHAELSYLATTEQDEKSCATFSNVDNRTLVRMNE